MGHRNHNLISFYEHFFNNWQKQRKASWNKVFLVKMNNSYSVFRWSLLKEFRMMEKTRKRLSQTNSTVQYLKRRRSWSCMMSKGVQLSVKQRKLWPIHTLRMNTTLRKSWPNEFFVHRTTMTNGVYIDKGTSGRSLSLLFERNAKDIIEKCRRMYYFDNFYIYNDMLG